MLLTSEVPIGGQQRTSYQAALDALRASGIEFLVGGAFALHQYLGRWRTTKDLDVFVRGGDVRGCLAALAGAGFDVELTDPAWLAKGRREGTLVDLIFSSYNRLFPVDDEWFENGREALVLGIPVKLVGPEEMVVSKAFVAARDRFDGSDIAWLIRTLGDVFDWKRIERMMAEHWEVLLWQLVHFRYVFPQDSNKVPRDLMLSLLGRLSDQVQAGLGGSAQTCRGPLFDAIHYLTAVREEAPPVRDYEPPF